jgi:cell division protein FtsB
MVVYRHKILLRQAKTFVESKHFESLKLMVLFVGLFIVILVFGLKIMSTINRGLETQKRTDKIAAEVQALEQENQELKNRKDLYTSDSEIESQFRELENKKKPDESVYVINIPDKKSDTATESSAQATELSKPKQSNWETWIQKIFQ